MASKYIVLFALVGVACAYVPMKREANATLAADGSASGSASGSVSGSASGSLSGAASIAAESWTQIQSQVSAVMSSSDHSSCLDLLGISNAKEQLEAIDYKKITVVAEIPDLTSVAKLSGLLDLKECISLARKRLVSTLLALANVSIEAGLEVDAEVKAAIHAAILAAIKAAKPVELLIEIVYNIIKVYFEIALTAPLFIASPSVIAEGISLASSCVSVVISASASVSVSA